MTESRVTFQNLSDSAIECRIDIKAAPEKVYAAWTEPDRLIQWFGPPKANGKLRIDHFDCKIGGTYDVSMVFDDGDQVKLIGTYQELDPPKKIVFTWQWAESTTPSDETLVTVLLAPSEKGTLLKLTHEKFLTTEARNSHYAGWELVLPRIARLFDETN